MIHRTQKVAGLGRTNRTKMITRKEEARYGGGGEGGRYNITETGKIPGEYSFLFTVHETGS